MKYVVFLSYIRCLQHAPWVCLCLDSLFVACLLFLESLIVFLISAAERVMCLLYIMQTLNANVSAVKYCVSPRHILPAVSWFAATISKVVLLVNCRAVSPRFIYSLSGFTPWCSGPTWCFWVLLAGYLSSWTSSSRPVSSECVSSAPGVTTISCLLPYHLSFCLASESFIWPLFFHFLLCFLRNFER